MSDIVVIMVFRLDYQDKDIFRNWNRRKCVDLMIFYLNFLIKS